jgi:hypothetical protein
MFKLKKPECHDPLFDVLEPNELEQLAIGYRTMIGSCTWSELDEIYQVTLPYLDSTSWLADSASVKSNRRT